MKRSNVLSGSSSVKRPKREDGATTAMMAPAEGIKRSEAGLPSAGRLAYGPSPERRLVMVRHLPKTAVQIARERADL